MKRVTRFVFYLALVANTNSYAKEGMWMPLLIEELNINDMQANGFKLSAKDIYSVNQTSLKDAIVIFGRGCTGEVISKNSLLLTNHHCGLGFIQKHSTLESNYLREGFWAMNQEEELPNPGLTVKFLDRIVVFTDSVLSSVDRSKPYSEQKPEIDKRILELETAVEDTSKLLASVESFFSGNEYYLFLYTEYKDVRLVGAPPSSIGNFGGDPDNWVWPRHTGDFSVFRIYTGPDGEPAAYSKDNIPLKPKKYLQINTTGISPNDFTMVLGYPGRTNEYLYSYELEFINEKLYPTRIETRDGRLSIIDRARSRDEKIYIQYATKQKRISNAWKKWRGVLNGFRKYDVIEKRKKYEAWLISNAGSEVNELRDLYQMFEDSYRGMEPYLLAHDLFNESVSPIEPFVLHVRAVQKLMGAGDMKFLESLSRTADEYFKDYNFNLDKELTKFMLWNFISKTGEEFIPTMLRGFTTKADLDKYIDKVYDKSVYTNIERFKKAIELLQKGKFSVFEKDLIYLLYNEFSRISYEQISENLNYYQFQLDDLHQEYILLIKNIDDDRHIYPDANSTMRMSYGKIEAYSPSDAIEYNLQTYLEGVFQKESVGHEDYIVHDKLKELFINKDYGKYADQSGQMPVCFIASNHTSGGNSGSPVLNANGQLIGLNFDRTWEGTMSDFHFDERICRNISVDIRYVLFVIDKFAGAGYLLDEMEIIW